MIIVVATIIAVLTVPLSGASLAPLSRLSLRHAWLAWLAIAVQVVMLATPGLPDWLGESLHLVTFVLAAACMWSNRALPGMFLIALGGGLNLLAIAANGGTMPASESAWRRAGLTVDADRFENSNVVHGARLPWLGDVFAIPKGWPLANVFSIGDVVIVVAIAYLAHVWCRRAPAPITDPAATPPVLAAG